jgi:hypothetical protein
MKSSFTAFSPTYPSKQLRFNGPSYSKMIMMTMMMMTIIIVIIINNYIKENVNVITHKSVIDKREKSCLLYFSPLK